MVEEVECLAACDTAPVFQVNYEFHGNARRRVGGRDDRGVPHRVHDVARGVSGGKRA